MKHSLVCLDNMISHLLSSLLLLLLFLFGILFLLWRSLNNLWWWCGFLLFLLLDGHKQANNLLGLDAVVLINLKLTEDVLDLSLGHLVSPGHEGVLEHLGIDLAFQVICLESLNNEVVGVISISSHLLLEHLDHVVISAGTTNFTKQVIKLRFSHQDTNVVEGSTKIILVNGSVLVDVHQLETVPVHLELLLREALILTLAHDECESETGRLLLLWQ